jgi:hypothetical protein
MLYTIIYNIYVCLFQAVTGIDNLDECIELLNQHDWDLMVGFRLILFTCILRNQNYKLLLLGIDT